MYGDGVSAGVCTLQNAFSYCRMCSLKMVSVQVSVSHHHTSYVTSSYMLCHKDMPVTVGFVGVGVGLVHVGVG